MHPKKKELAPIIYPNQGVALIMNPFHGVAPIMHPNEAVQDIISPFQATDRNTDSMVRSNEEITVVAGIAP